MDGEDPQSQEDIPLVEDNSLPQAVPIPPSGSLVTETGIENQPVQSRNARY